MILNFLAGMTGFDTPEVLESGGNVKPEVAKGGGFVGMIV
jgi:hypothetical protein